MFTPPFYISKNQIVNRNKRNSNLELYRIIVMILIVMHHYVVNSGLNQIIHQTGLGVSSAFMVLFGAWGKTGINCFVLITGYFMCKLKFTWQKLFKLYAQVLFYTLIIYGIFIISGHETFNIKTIFFKIFPFDNISSGFVNCFILFYLLVPFLNILTQHLTKRMHGLLVSILLFIYTILPSFALIGISFNYIEWFVVLYIIASYLRFYGDEFKISHNQWGLLALSSFLVSCVSVFGLFYLWATGRINEYKPYYLVADSNKILALLTAVTSFMWFKDLKIKYNPVINAIGATTFGVLLIHANSDTMRQWLWKGTVDCVGHFGPSVMTTLGYAIAAVLLIFFVCSFIDWLRIMLVEPHLMRWFDRIVERTRARKERLRVTAE